MAAQSTTELLSQNENIKNGKSRKEKAPLDYNVGKLTAFPKCFCACLSYSNVTNGYRNARQTCTFNLATVFMVAQKDFLCKRLISLTKI